MGTTSAQTDPERANDEANPSGSSIEAFFANSVIFITGATGFLGKALVEKLLRSCPRLSTIFLLIRPKKGQTVEERFQALMSNSIFDRIRWEHPNAIKKVFPIEGDVGEPGLGLNSHDRMILMQSVNIVFHSAATIRFDEPLKVAVKLNIKATDQILDLCKSMSNLTCLIHVSTAYSNADRREVKELIYATKITPHVIMDMCENLDDETIGLLEKRLLDKHPNTYTLTKGLAEELISKKGLGLPIAIVRPSIICAAYHEPFPGWIDNICGVTGIITEISRGTIRSIIGDRKLKVDIVPVDYVVDTLICACWHSAIHRDGTIQVYNCTSSTVNPLSWGEFVHLVRKCAIESPSKYVMWYPSVTFRTNQIIHKLIVATMHFLPAFVLDLLLRCQGSKPIMLKITKRINRAANIGQFFTLHEWDFSLDNMMDLIKSVKTTNDCSRFHVDVNTLNWEAYTRQYTLGIRKYILKDNPDTLNRARSRLSKLYWLRKITQILSLLFLFRLLKRVGR